MSTLKQIQWFPGHMFKSLREMKERMKLVDLIAILLDSRLPISSMNPEIMKLSKQKPAMILLNKMDLADPKVLKSYETYFQENGYHTLKIDAQSGKNVKNIYALATVVLKEKIEREQRKGLKMRPIRMMILGIPNVGKSTLINQLSKSSAAKTANTPGVTKSQQWIKLSDQFELLDTPGVLWPKFDDPKVGYHLAITGAIKDRILPEDDVVVYALNFLKTYYPKRLFDRYGITLEMDIADMFHHIGATRGALVKGGDLDMDRINQIILTDIRNQGLGGLSFDRLETL